LGLEPAALVAQHDDDVRRLKAEQPAGSAAGLEFVVAAPVSP
jgi:hypothetical protein